MPARFAVTYRIFAGSEAEAAGRAAGIALEQTVEIPRDVVPAGYVEDEILGKVEALTQESEATWTATVTYSPDSAGGELPQLLNVVFGNSSIQKGLKVTGIELTKDMNTAFPGARFGAAGIRELARRPQGGFVCPVIKPMGLSTADLALTAGRVAEAGADIVKEDHGLANQPTAPFRDRIPALAEAVARANTARQARGDDGQSLYFASLAGPQAKLVEDAYFAKEHGAHGVLIIPGLQGFDAMKRLADDPGFGLPVMAHPSFLGPMVLSPDTGFTHGTLFGTLMRLAGADISVFPNYGGRFGFSREECAEIAANCLGKDGSGQPILPSPGGGMSVERMPELHGLYGEDCVYLLGGALLRYGDKIGDGIRAMKDVLDKA